MIGKRFIGPFLALLALAFSCTDANFDLDPGSSGGGGGNNHRQPVQQTRNVMIMVSGGFNSLSSYLTADLQEMAEGFLPQGTYQSAHVLVVLSRLPANGFSTTPAPVLYRLYAGVDGKPVRDTLKRWNETDPLFGGTLLKDALHLVQDRYPAKSYGMVLSSHASGWLPPGYYEKPSDFEGKSKLRSIGQDKDGSVSTEMDLMDFARSIPYKLKYVVLDCCLSGGIEVAWALKDKAEKVAFTQTETMAEGFDYSAIVRRLLGTDTPDPLGVCQDFYQYYLKQSGVMQSATISLLETDQMEGLASLCATLFEKYRAQIKSLPGTAVQGYFRFGRHFFYDMRDILVKAGISDEEKEQLDMALANCIVYKAATPYFMKGTSEGFAIKTHSGLSMYLPSMGTQFLDNYYKENIGWNSITHLVE